MISKLQFKFQLLFYHLKRLIPFFLFGLLFGSAAYYYHQNLASLFKLPIFQQQSIGILGLYTADNLPDQITGDISLGLTTLSPEDQKITTSSLIKNYTSDGNQGYIFELDTSRYWHDGQPLTPKSIFYDIDGVTIESLSPSSVKITTSNTYSPLLAALSQPLLKPNLIGLGPYRLQKATYLNGFFKQIVLKPTSAGLPTKVYKFYTSESNLISAYKLGEVDQISTQSPPNLTSWPNTKITPQIQTDQRYLGLFFNTEKLSSKQLRQAIAYATPKTTDQNERCLGPISPNSWAYNPQIKNYLFDPQKAKEFFSKNPIDTITISVSDRQLLPLAEEIKSSWQSVLGLTVSITIENQLDWDNFDAILTYNNFSHDPDQYYFWHSSQTKTNITKLNNPRIDKLLEQGRQTLNYPDRKQIYADFQRFLLEEAPAIFLKFPTTYTITRGNPISP